LFQYSRIVYLRSCQLVPLSTEPALICDCQQSSPDLHAGDKQHNTESTFSKLRQEEVFMTFSLPAPGRPCRLLLPGRMDRSSGIIAGCVVPIFQPPRGNVSFPLFIWRLHNIFRVSRHGYAVPASTRNLL